MIKLGNYALPVFGAFLTAMISISNVEWSGSIGQHLLVAFSLYTILSVFVSYCHRIMYLRYQNAQKVEGVLEEKRKNLPTRSVIFFLVLHIVLIIILLQQTIFYHFYLYK